jgi:hypothetical protein
MTRPMVAVVGCTGAQAGRLVDAILASNDFAVRAITRKPDSHKGKALAAQPPHEGRDSVLRGHARPHRRPCSDPRNRMQSLIEGRGSITRGHAQPHGRPCSDPRNRMQSLIEGLRLNHARPRAAAPRCHHDAPRIHAMAPRYQLDFPSVR